MDVTKSFPESDERRKVDLATVRETTRSRLFRDRKDVESYQEWQRTVPDPMEQVRLYRALDAGAGGGTPDDHALAMIEEQIEVSAREEDAVRSKIKKREKPEMWRTHRFVIATADGGSNDAGAVKAANDRLKKKDISVDLFLIAPETDSNLLKLVQNTYQNVSPTPDPSALAEKGLASLTKRLKAAYELK